MIENKETMIRLLEALFPQVKIYLFGSQARGTAKAYSDIDLALDIGKKMTFVEIERAKNVLTEGLGLILDELMQKIIQRVQL